VYDGVCGLCAGTVRFLEAHSEPGTFVYVPRASAAAHAALAAHPAAAAIDGVIVLEGGRLWAKSDAVLRIAARVRAPWRAAGILATLPRALREAAYDLVARNRLRWFGRPRPR
jgi:predicted DCC family thiol-disulfide oxidoreductase YuxK